MDGRPRRKIINDPVHGFLTIRHASVFKIIEHPYFQRLRRIKQLGLSHLVYPGAMHTRYQHTLGAVHLMGLAIEELRAKGHTITDDEAEAVTLAILLHDIGHGPFSHALEFSIGSGVDHEMLSDLFMEHFAAEFGGLLPMAIEIFHDRYPKRFLHQLLSGQLDMDRLDYLRRDSFFSGVTEGNVGSERIIRMLTVAGDDLAVEDKGVYSVEQFINARRIMYWQVYLHKTVLSAEFMLIKTLQRAKELARNGVNLFGTPAFTSFLSNDVSLADFKADPMHLYRFAQLDDMDVICSLKVWKDHPDPVLSRLSRMVTSRELLKVKLYPDPVPIDKVNELRQMLMRETGLTAAEVEYLVFTDKITNSAYDPRKDRINILYRDGSVCDITEATDTRNISMLSEKVEKHFLCVPAQIQAHLP